MNAIIVLCYLPNAAKMVVVGAMMVLHAEVLNAVAINNDNDDAKLDSMPQQDDPLSGTANIDGFYNASV